MMQSGRFTRLGILHKMMTLKAWYHCDYFSIRPRVQLIEGGDADWGLPLFSELVVGLALHSAGPFFFQVAQFGLRRG
jgi:hypothetical protein